MDDAIRKRASGFQRSTISNALRFALDDGQLNFMEYTERNNTALAATYRDELIPLVTDLDLGAGLPRPIEAAFLDQVSSRFQQPITPDELEQQLHSQEVAQQQPAAPPAAAGVSGSQWVASQTADGSWLPNTNALFGDVKRHGSWVCGPSHTVNMLFGDVTLDFTKATLTSNRVDIQLLAGFGDVNIIVPEEFHVQENVANIFSTVKIKDARGVRPATSIDPSTPLLVIQGCVAFGTVKIKRVLF